MLVKAALLLSSLLVRNMNCLVILGPQRTSISSEFEVMGDLTCEGTIYEMETPCCGLGVDELCGDGVVSPLLSEECDDANSDPEDGCHNCRFGSCPQLAPVLPQTIALTVSCGNGRIDPGEQCDDSNAVSEDGCSAACALEYCGDGILQAGLGEECDDRNSDPSDGCHACAAFICGNGRVDAAVGETCDDGNTVSGDGCNSTCLLDSVVYVGATRDFTTFCDAVDGYLSLVNWDLMHDVIIYLDTGTYSVTTVCDVDFIGIGSIEIRSATGNRDDVILQNDIPGCSGWSGCGIIDGRRGTVRLIDVTMKGGTANYNTGMIARYAGGTHFASNVVCDSMLFCFASGYQGSLGISDAEMVNLENGGYAVSVTFMGFFTTSGATSVTCLNSRMCESIISSLGALVRMYSAFTATKVNWALHAKDSSSIYSSSTITCNDCDAAVRAIGKADIEVDSLITCTGCDRGVEARQRSSVRADGGQSHTEITDLCVDVATNSFIRNSGTFTCQGVAGGANNVAHIRYGSVYYASQDPISVTNINSWCWWIETQSVVWISKDGCTACGASCTNVAALVSPWDVTRSLWDDVAP